MPGFDDSKMLEREKRIIGMTGRLEFHIVDEVGSEELLVGVSEKLPKDGPVKVLWEQVVVGERVVKSYYLAAKDDLKSGRSGRDILRELLKAIEIPQDRVIGYEKYREVDEAGNPSSGVMWRTYYLERTAELTGAYLESAAVFNDEQTGQPYVSLDFNQAGGKLFEELTARNVKRRLAIQVDDQVQSAPTIQEKIPGGRCRVTLGAYESADRLRREAWNLVVVLRAGALPAPIRLLKEELIKPR
jgi:preprotein translocase subunit SecD